MSPPAPLPLTQVDLWFTDYVDIVDGARLDQYAALLDAEETARRQRFLFDRDRRAYAISHALLRTTLSHYAAVPPEQWVFTWNNYGRPEIDEPAAYRDLRFNLSHTRGAALVGVVKNLDLGVDLEMIDRDAACVELADRYFSPREVAELRSHPTANRRDRFFDYWTLKEAYIKARGMGLAIPLDQFSYLLDDASPIGIEFSPELPDAPADWQFTKFRPAERFQAAVAVKRGSSSPLQFVLRHVVPLASIGEPQKLPS